MRRITPLSILFVLLWTTAAVLLIGAAAGGSKDLEARPATLKIQATGSRFHLDITPDLSPAYLPSCTPASCIGELDLLCGLDVYGPAMCQAESVFAGAGVCSCHCYGGGIAVSACSPSGIQDGPDGFPTAVAP